MFLLKKNTNYTTSSRICTYTYKILRLNLIRSTFIKGLEIFFFLDEGAGSKLKNYKLCTEIKSVSIVTHGIIVNYKHLKISCIVNNYFRT